MRKAAIAALAITTATLLWLSDPWSVQPYRTVRMGVDAAAPYQSWSEQGRPVGFSVDILNEAARRAGIRLEWVHGQGGPKDSFDRKLVDAWPVLSMGAAERWGLHAVEPWMHNQYAAVWRGP